MALKTPHLPSNFARRPSSHHSFSQWHSPPHHPKLPPRPDPQTRVAIATKPPPPPHVVRKRSTTSTLMRCRDGLGLHGFTDDEAVHQTPEPEDHQTTELPVVTHPSVVFPGATLQLHAFEFRSRIMAHTLLQQGLSFGVVCRGGVADVGCVVHVVECERLTDGRFFLTCVGRDRFRVVETVRTKPYAVARVQVFRDRDHSHHHHHRDLMQQVERHLGNVAALADKLGQKPPPLPYRQGDRRLHTAASLSFLVARLFVDDRREQQALLRMDDAAQRLAREGEYLERRSKYLAALAAIKDAFQHLSCNEK